jgi:hypothetical protein
MVAPIRKMIRRTIRKIRNSGLSKRQIDRRKEKIERKKDLIRRKVINN